MMRTSRQVLYLLIGFLLAWAFLIPYAHAANYGTYCSKGEAQAAILSALGDDPAYDECIFYDVSLSSAGSMKMYYYPPGYSTTYVATYGGHYAYYAATEERCYSLGCEGCENFGDSDGDGIPDECDYYPDDGVFHSVREVGRYRSGDGETIVASLWETNRGDYYVTGSLPASGGVDDNYYSVTGDDWHVPDCSDGNISGDGFPQDFDDDEIPWDPDIPDPDLDDPQMPDGSDSDSALLGKIANNSGATATGVNSLNNYAASLVSAVNGIRQDTSLINQNINDLENAVKSQTSSVNNTASNTGAIAAHTATIAGHTATIAGHTGLIVDNTGATAANTGAMATSLGNIENSLDSSDADASKAQMDGLSVGNYYNSSNYTGELVEGTDYETVEGLGDQSWFSDFVSSNPYKTALDNSGFECSGAVCEMMLTLPVLGGSHKLSICQFDEQFSAAGTLLLSLTTLAGFVLLVRG